MVTDLKKESNISMQTVGPSASSNQSQGASHFCYAKKLLKESLKVKPLTFKGDSHSKHPTDPDTLIKRLPSPKVLFTTNSKSQNTTYKKRKIDLSDLAENVEDKIMYSDLSDLMKPLHSEELESYLASLSHRVPDKVIHDSIGSIPLTKCKFFIGEHLNDIEASDGKTSCDKIDNQNDVTQVEKTSVVTDIDDRIISGKDRTSDSGGNTNSTTFHKTQEKQKSLSRKNFEKLSLSLVNDGHQSGISHDGNHGCRSHDGSPNGLSLTDDESSDNSTPTNSLSECNANHFKNEKQFTHNASPSIKDVKPTSNSDGDLNDSLEEEIAKLHLSDNKCVGLVQNNSVTMVTSEKKKEDKLALGKTLCKHLMTKELNKIGRPDDISMPNQEEIMIFQRNLGKSSSMMFSTATGLPTRSSPVSIHGNTATGLPTRSSPVSIHGNTATRLPTRSSLVSIHGNTATGLPTRSSLVSIHGNTATGLPTRSSPVSIHGNTATGLPTRSSPVSIHGNTATGLPTRSSLVSIHGNTATGLPTRSSPVSIHGNTATGLPTRSSLVSIHGNTAAGLPTRSSLVSIHGNTATGLPTRSSLVSIHGNTATGLPTRSSPAPTKRKSSGGRFDYDNTLISTKAIKNALSCSKLALQSESSTDHEESQKVLSTSAPASTNCLLGNFEVTFPDNT
ncbi:unnamed protein product [Mytilus edulis]|uniref:Uncharacterized protein n=1 Tax=Mytilus edulis TaxID=6550 RepID=A0A8S3VNV5_MYTED|nr:unnamed protein product [Mytilus edulis]